MNPKEAWRIEHEKIESMYRGDVDQILIGHHAEFLHQYCKLRRKMKKPGEGILEIQQRIDEIYPIALKKADECFPGARNEDMTVCGFCGREAWKLSQCPLCGGKYCDDCIHPRAHNCVRGRPGPISGCT